MIPQLHGSADRHLSRPPVSQQDDSLELWAHRCDLVTARRDVRRGAALFVRATAGRMLNTPEAGREAVLWTFFSLGASQSQAKRLKSKGARRKQFQAARLLQQRQEGRVREHPRVPSVVRYPANVPRREPRVEGVAHCAESHDAVPSLHVARRVPERRGLGAGGRLGWGLLLVAKPTPAWVGRWRVSSVRGGARPWVIAARGGRAGGRACGKHCARKQPLTRPALR